MPRVRRRPVRAAQLQPDVRDPTSARWRARARRSTCGRRRRRGIFINFKNVIGFARKKPPFGIAQVGKSFRNEITPRHFIFRTREFEQMEMEFFVPPAEADRWYREWIEIRERWYNRPRPAARPPADPPPRPDELSHYSSGTSDVEYLFPIGWSELEGIANRGDFDLKAHNRPFRREARVLRPADQRTLRPPCDRARRGRRPGDARLPGRLLRGRGGRGRRRTVLRLHPRLARSRSRCCRSSPRRASRRKRTRSSKTCGGRLNAEFDEGGSIGKRYRRQDEIGTPWGVTVDFQTMDDDTVTLRDRDSLEQVRIPIEGLADELAGRLESPWQSPQARLSRPRLNSSAAPERPNRVGNPSSRLIGVSSWPMKWTSRTVTRRSRSVTRGGSWG